ncbi:MAG: nuclear transport factor 2 family protein [Acidobacteria bacterium]|nr:nuclear transport factor 2 family protein [Acidobacteriota bacterium]
MRSPKETIKIWVKAFNDHDAIAASECYHNDAENLQVAIGIPLKGKQAILKDLEEFFAGTPDSYTNIENLFEDGQWAMLEWSGGGNFVAKDGSRKPYTLRGCGFFHIIDGKIKFQRGYWDKYTWFSQVGLPIE